MSNQKGDFAKTQATRPHSLHSHPSFRAFPDPQCVAAWNWQLNPCGSRRALPAAAGAGAGAGAGAVGCGGCGSTTISEATPEVIWQGVGRFEGAPNQNPTLVGRP